MCGGGFAIKKSYHFCLLKDFQKPIKAQSPYAQLCAATTLTKLISKPSSTLPIKERIEIKNYVLQYLYDRQLEPFVSKALIQLYAKITKLGWLDSLDSQWVFRNVMDEIEKFLGQDITKCIIGVDLLRLLIVEVDKVGYADNARPLTKQRKTAGSFRDTTLLDSFKTSIRLLRAALKAQDNFNVSDQRQLKLVSSLLELSYAALTFDFIGTCQDESSDDQTTVQIPTGWRSLFLSSTKDANDSVLNLFFDLYKVLPADFCQRVLSCLVQMASIRRSLFSNEERQQFLASLVRGICLILKNGSNLSNLKVYHEFCRLLGRLKANYQLGELTSLDEYSEAIRLIAEFTVQSLKCFQFSPNSLHYLLGLWQRLTASIPYIRNARAHELEKYTPSVIKAYVESRLQCAKSVLFEGMDNPLDDQNSLIQQMDQISTISRCEYEETTKTLSDFFDQTSQLYGQAIQGQLSEQDKRIVEFQLAWLVYIIGAAIGGRVSINSSDEQDALDGNLIIKGSCSILSIVTRCFGMFSKVLLRLTPI